MAGARTLLYRSITAALDPCSRSTPLYGSFRNVPRFSFLCLPTVSDLFNKYRATDWPLQHMGRRQDRISALSPISHYLKCRTDSSTEYSIKSSEQNRLMNTMLHYQCTSFPSSISARSHIRAYSSHAVGKNDGLQNASEVPSNVAIASTDKATDSAGNDWVDFLNQSYQAVADAVVNAGKKVKEVSDEVVAPYMQQLYDAHPYLESVIVPVGGTLSATILAWVVMPKILRKFHKFARQSPFTLLAGSSTKKEAPYERSLWSALEDPARYLVTFMAFSQLSVLIVPSVSQYLSQVWRGAVVLSFIWFLHQWKTNFFARTLANEVSVGLDRDRLLQLERISSVGLLVLGVMALAEACGVAVQSILTVGGIGGVATAFASRDILGNVFSGLSLQFSRPFSVGDNIKAGLVEGQVVEMGLTTTSLINPEKFPVIVPNSLFSSQVIVNKSRAQWCASLTKIPLRIDDLDRIPVISEEIKSMLRSHPKVFLDMDAPYCYLSRIEDSFGELTIGCNLKNMKKDELYATEQDILLQAAKIIRKLGAELGRTVYQSTGH